MCFDDRQISTLEIVICSLLSHHIFTPNELICLTPSAIKRSIVDLNLDRPFICLPSSKMTSYLMFESVLSLNFKMLSEKTNSGNYLVKAGETVKQ